MVTITALYKNWEAADSAVELLLDGGLSHSEIAMMSGHYWTGSNGAGSQKVVVEVRTPYPKLAETAQKAMDVSSPLAMRRTEDGWRVTHSLPVTVTPSSAQDRS
jgi:hypothetical protein